MTDEMRMFDEALGALEKALARLGAEVERAKQKLSAPAKKPVKPATSAKKPATSAKKPATSAKKPATHLSEDKGYSGESPDRDGIPSFVCPRADACGDREGIIPPGVAAQRGLVPRGMRKVSMYRAATADAKKSVKPAPAKKPVKPAPPEPATVSAPEAVSRLRQALDARRRMPASVVLMPHEVTLNLGSFPVRELAEVDAKDLLGNPRVFWYRPTVFPDPRRAKVQPHVEAAKVVKRNDPKFTRAPWTVNVTIAVLGDDKHALAWGRGVFSKNKAEQE